MVSYITSMHKKLACFDLLYRRGRPNINRARHHTRPTSEVRGLLRQRGPLITFEHNNARKVI
ncbi:hypothetical protein CBM2589_U10257 [Cupriavidus taiwanensis]|uniref:Uncharacterized protein n=1 Tax=Cupriavidus taiwanensis TaxID=164546 RepID=A0A375CQQ4_9BURK|nr:hypothetical protein CBM2589_U10257 [Cupriavidus taiwanensis]